MRMKSHHEKLSTENFKDEVFEILSEKGLQLENQHLFFALYDWAQLKMKGHHFGGGRFFLNKKEINLVNKDDRPLSLDSKDNSSSNKNYFEIKLSPGDRLYFLSYGLEKVMHELKIFDELKKFLFDHFSNNIFDVFHEFYFQIYKKKSNEFLNHDTTLFSLEVNKNVLFQV